MICKLLEGVTEVEFLNRGIFLIKKLNYIKILRQLLNLSTIALSMYLSIKGIIFFVNELAIVEDQVKIIKSLMFFLVMLSLFLTLVTATISDIVKRLGFEIVFIYYLFLSLIVGLAFIGYQEKYFILLIGYLIIFALLGIWEKCKR